MHKSKGQPKIESCGNQYSFTPFNIKTQQDDDHDTVMSCLMSNIFFQIFSNFVGKCPENSPKRSLIELFRHRLCLFN